MASVSVELDSSTGKKTESKRMIFVANLSVLKSLSDILMYSRVHNKNTIQQLTSQLKEEFFLLFFL